VTAAIRIGGRRWNLRIDNGIEFGRLHAFRQIAGVAKAQGLNVSGHYVSTIKSNARKARWLAQRTLIVRGTARKTRGTGRSSSMSGIPAALEFIKAAGGLENAKSALGTIEEIGNAVR
jgi:hypothetical protein